MKRIGIIGAGAWGLALATAAREAGSKVLVWSREPKIIEEINAHKPLSLALPGIILDKAIQGTTHLAEVCKADILVLVVPAQAVRLIAQDIKPFLQPKQILVIASKGIEINTNMLMTEVLQEVLGDRRVVVLSGPNFAKEVAQKLPAGTAVGSTDEAAMEKVVNAFKSTMFRPYVNFDPIGVQIGGAVKNVLAIGCGIVCGAGLGENARAAVITRGLTEMVALGYVKGAHQNTFYGLSGMGDLLLTAMSPQSRNFSFGYALGQNGNVAEMVMNNGATVEGVPTAYAVAELAKRLKVEMTLCLTIKQILYDQLPIPEAIMQLLSRPVTSE
jgi:glycerol-3-phosphate dehydrogenase (NAD(P)+)